MLRAPLQTPADPQPQIRVRGRSLLALVVTPELPATAWFAALDEQLRASALLLARPVVVDLSLVWQTGGPEGAGILLEGLEARRVNLVAVEGVGPAGLAGTPWERLARSSRLEIATRAAHEVKATAISDRPANGDKAGPCLTIDRPVRSGQIVMFEAGDVIVIGPVASGAEVIAGGSIHVYGSLRGRAVAGVKTGEAARIFCRKLEAEMVAVGLHYRTADNWGADLHGRAVQVWCDRGALRLSALD